MIKPPTSGATTGVYSVNNVPQGSGPLVGIDGAYSSINTPNWRNLNPYQRATIWWNPFTYERRMHASSEGRAVAVNTYPLPNSTTSYTGPILKFPASYNVVNANGNITFPVTDAEQKALSRIQSRIANASVNLAQAYAERRQTVSMITNRINTFINAARRVRHGDFIGAGQGLLGYGPNPFSRNGPSHPQNLANHWLEFQYGWRPLLSDIYGGCQAIFNAWYANRPMYFSAAADAVGYIPQMLLKQGPMPSSGHHWEWRAAAISYSEHVRYVIQVEEDNTLLNAMASLGATNPALLAWELLPYSFVVDWFYPVGNFLQQLEYARGLVFRRGTVSHRKKLVGATFLKYVNDGTLQPGQSGFCAGGNGYLDYVHKDRVVLSGFPYARFPSFQPSLGVERALSAISLLTQVFTTGRTSRR
jgi:hypothetical protein